MLGNFSFGDYFKEPRDRACLEPDHQGVRARQGPAAGHRLCHTDDEAAVSGRRSPACPMSRIIRIATSRQFLGDGRHRALRPVLGDLLRPRRPHLKGGPPGSPDEDGDRFLEIWNLVFMQFEQVRRRKSAYRCRAPRSIPAWGSSASPPCCRATHDNYEIDLFKALIAASEEAHRRWARPRGQERGRAIASSPITCARSCFLIADGVLPSNEGRGYVLRRIMRRAMRHAQLLGASEPLMWKLVPALGPRDGSGLSRTRAWRER